MKLSKTLTAAVFVALSSAAFAADEVNVVNGLTVTGSPLGLHGVDPVSMFRSEAPATGDATFTSDHDGVAYYFASAEAQGMFDAAPESYLPQFGGFCAFGVYKGKKFDGDVRYADVVDGKLYLFVNAAVFELYLEDKQAVIAGAEDTWPGIRSTAVEDL